jgi:hypothetical protein
MNKLLIRKAVCCLVVIFFFLGAVPKVEAGFVPSTTTTVSDSTRIADVEKIQRALETKLIKDRLEKLGLSREEIQFRVDRLSDTQVHQLALKVEELNTGGDALGVVVAILVIAILVWVVFYLYGHRIVIK